MDVVGMCHSLSWLKSKEVARRTRPPVFSAVSIVPTRRWRSAAGEMDGARAWETGETFRRIMPELSYMKLLVVTVRAAWFNFRAWKKRL